MPRRSESHPGRDARDKLLPAGELTAKFSAWFRRVDRVSVAITYLHIASHQKPARQEIQALREYPTFHGHCQNDLNDVLSLHPLSSTRDVLLGNR